MQDRGGREVVELESVELQEPAEERMYRESESPYQIRDEAYSLPFIGAWGSLRLPPTLISNQSGPDWDHEGRREKSPRLELH